MDHHRRRFSSTERGAARTAATLIAVIGALALGVAVAAMARTGDSGPASDDAAALRGQ